MSYKDSTKATWAAAEEPLSAFVYITFMIQWLVTQNLFIWTKVFISFNLFVNQRRNLTDWWKRKYFRTAYLLVWFEVFLIPVVQHWKQITCCLDVPLGYFLFFFIQVFSLLGWKLKNISCIWLFDLLLNQLIFSSR